MNNRDTLVSSFFPGAPATPVPLFNEDDVYARRAAEMYAIPFVSVTAIHRERAKQAAYMEVYSG